jgi:hypothetical protein
MTYSKEFLDALLIADKEYTSDRILNFKNLPKGIITTNFTDFVYGSTSNPENPFRIEPFELFLLKIDEPNAFAFKYDGMYIIGIHLSLFSLLEKRIREKVPKLKDKAAAMILSIESCLENGLNGQFTMYQFITLFTYYHELAHLHQLKHEDDLRKPSRFEKYFLIEGKQFDQIAHAMEIDADLIAANQIARHILQYWEGFALEKRTIENLEAFISMVSASIFLFFFELAGGWQNLYYLDFDHPHSLIRTGYITDAIANIAALTQKEDFLKPDSAKCVSGGLVIAQQLLNDGMSDGLNEFIQNFMNHQDQVDAYVKEMSEFNKTVPFLISNWYK